MLYRSLYHIPYLLLLLGGLTACTPSLPQKAVMQERGIPTLPCYANAVLPPNIAPLNFRIETEGEAYRTCFYTRSSKQSIVCRGQEVNIPIEAWHKLLNEAKGDTLYRQIYVKQTGIWKKYPVQKNPIAEEPIDTYLAYRLIEPSYVNYETMTINQRNLTDFDEKIIYDNSSLSDGDKGQCVNCHAYQNYNRTGKMQMHVRERLGGTLFVNGDKAVKVNLKTGQTLSAGVYPAWHPTADLLAYSVNSTGQSFHTKDIQKVEVLDFASDLILYDVQRNKVYEIACRKDEFETFPAWAPDGKRLYYVSAHYEQQTSDIDAELDANYKELKYNIYSRRFDPSALTFGSQDTVYMASRTGKSATLPRLSPDGRYLLFTMADYGNFHIWHRSADLYLLDLENGETGPLETINSEAVESYHSWSSNGRWIVFSSRRDDGNYTRPYISYFDKEGKAHTPFLLPQKRSNHYERLFKSYNIPEFMVTPAAVSRRTLVRAIEKEALPALYAGSSSEEFSSEEW